ncbi:hypothetical protein ATCC90586_005130 [Pythium insidiosum]|nr:hypothetical protein ATCC90586_005130 [Pythium insidiosum]
MSSARDKAREASINPSSTVRTSVTIYLSLLGLGLLVFEGVRRRYRRAYDSRGTEGNAFWTRSAGAQWERCFGWVATVLRTTDDEILERCGLDTLCFLRFLRMGEKVALLAVGLSAVLFPLYATSSPPPTATRRRVDPLERITMSNLATRDWRLWASAVTTFIVCGYAMHLMLLEYRYYVRRRHELLSRLEAPMYTVLVNDLPLKLRTRQTLEQYMNKVFPNTVRSVYVAVECGKLEELVNEREAVRNALEHALAVGELKGTRPKHREGRSWMGMLLCRRGSRGDIVDSLDFYQERLAKLNEKVAREIAGIEEAQAQLARHVESGEQGGTVTVVAATREEDWSVARHVNARVMEDNRNRVGWLDVSAFNDDDDSPVEHDDSGGVTDDDEGIRARSRSQHPIQVMRRSAFISFTSLMSTHVVQQTLQASNPECMVVTPAPHVEDVNWSNIGLQYRTRAIGSLFSALLTAVVVIFWTIPTAFVASLASVESLRRALPFLNRAFDEHPFLETIFKQVAPLTLVGLNALAPIVFGLLSSREGHPSNAEVRASTFSKLAYFQLIQIFFAIVIFGTVFDSLKEILDQPKTLINMLGRSMPQQSTFFMSYVIVLTGLSHTVELLRLVPLLLAALFMCLAPRLTWRERNSTWYGLSAVSTTEPFDPTKPLADAFLVMLVTFTFASIAPLVCYFTWLFFFVADVVYRRQVLYVYKSTSFAMGAFWPPLFEFLIVALVLSQLTLLGLFSLKQAPIPFFAVLILVICILLFRHYVMRLFPRAATYLPLCDCVRIDELRQTQDSESTFRFLDGAYKQPAMGQRLPLRPDYQMLMRHRDDDRGGLVSPPMCEHDEDQRLFVASPDSL